VLDIGPCDARLLLIMRHPTGEPAAAFQFVVRHVMTSDGQATPWPQVVLDRAANLMVEAPAYASARTLSLEAFESAASLDRARALGLMRTGLTVLAPSECDAFGRMRFDIFLGRIADGMPRLSGLMPPIAGRGARHGGAAVEYRLIYFDQPRIGDRIEIRSGVVEVTPRYRRTAHWLLDPETGKAWGVAANVGVSFDLETRKLTTRSPEEVAAGQAQVVAGLTL
jgi:acyl-CoA thioester hydrolase